MQAGRDPTRLALPRLPPRPQRPPPDPLVLNDIHSQLNPTRVHSLHSPTTLHDLQSLIHTAAVTNTHISISGGRHAMARQQFGTRALHIDTSRLTSILNFDPRRGTIEAQSGITWPDLIAACRRLESPDRPWAIAQKQTGADRLSLGGSIAANIHGRGLKLPPLIHDIEALTLVSADGDPIRCSRTENRELFSLAVGGYGLFGIVYSAELRLLPRRTLRRDVALAEIEDVVPALTARADAGTLYGDFQFDIDHESPAFLRRGVLSTYTPVPGNPPVPESQLALSESDWLKLLKLAHHDKAAAYEHYTRHYLATDGQLYHSDAHQLSTYLDDYHRHVPHAGYATDQTATEMIGELYVPPEALPDFMAAAATILKSVEISVVYGTVRLIEPDTETFLSWATQRAACIVLNLCTPHTTTGLDRTARAFRALIDAAADRRGSYYLTYHDYATPDQIRRCYPRFTDFLDRKIRYDPHERFRSDWYLRHRDHFR
jgi:FAD/FMN-containing dehydrogenase